MSISRRPCLCAGVSVCSPHHPGMYTLHPNPPSPLWKQLADSNRLAPQSGDGHVTCTSQLPISPVRVERYLKPKQAMMVTTASPRMERRVAASGAKASGQPAHTAVLAEKSASLHFGQLGGHAFVPVPQTEISTQPVSADLSSQGQNTSLSAARSTQMCTTSRKVARLLTFSDSSLRDVDDATLPQAKDSSHVLYSADSLELSDIASTASTEMNRSSVVSPRFYDGLPISLEELLSSSSDASASTSPQLGKEGAASAPVFSFTSPPPVRRWQEDDSKANPRPPPQLAAIPLSPHGADTIIRPRSSPVPSRRGDYISSQESHGTLSINSLQATGGVCGGRGEMDEQTDITSSHRPRLLQPRLSTPRVAMATNTRVQPVAVPPSDTTQMLPNVFSSRGPDTKTLR